MQSIHLRKLSLPSLQSFVTRAHHFLNPVSFFLSPFQLIPPWDSVPFIPPYHKNLENARVRLRVLDVAHCAWTVHNLGAVDEDLQVIEFIPHATLPQQTGGAPPGAPQMQLGAMMGGLPPSGQPLLPPPPPSPRSTDGAPLRKALQRLPTKTLVTAASAAAAAVGAATNSSANPLQSLKGYTGVSGPTTEGGDAEDDPFNLQQDGNPR